MKRVIATLLIAAFAAGCASTKEKETKAMLQADIVEKATAQAAVPLFKLTCPASGCMIGSLEVGNPSAGAQLGEIARVAFAPVRSEAVEVFGMLIDGAKTLGGIGLVSNGIAKIMSAVTSGQVAMATAGFSAVGTTAASGFASNASIAGRIQAPAVPQANVTNNIGGDGVIGSGSFTGPVTTTTNTNPNPMVVTCTGTPPVCTR